MGKVKQTERIKRIKSLSHVATSLSTSPLVSLHYKCALALGSLDRQSLVRVDFSLMSNVFYEKL